jgi:hypothetical protein
MRQFGSVAFALSLASAWGGCGPTVQEQGELAAEPLDAPPRATFPHVANAMQMHCGTLDCHGQVSRDLRLYGLHGLRLDPKDNPLAHVTTRAEYDASYWSLVGLEPEALSFVVASGLRPERLTMVRKARGIEKHKGGQLMFEGDPLDRCIVTWITGDLDDAACSTVLHAERPSVD